MRYEAILLDFYGTLVEEDDRIIDRIVRAIAEDSPARPTSGQVASAWRFSEVCAAAHGSDFRTQRELERESLRTLLNTYQSRLSADELSEELYAYWRAPRAYAESKAFLDGLGIPVCIASNIDRDDITAALAHHRWSFKRVVTSQCCRSYKPRPEVFRRALDILGVRPEEALHVGDSWRSDVLGAHACGIPVAWINRRGGPRPDDQVPVAYEVANLAELGALLKNAR
ncbi:MAG: HAD family hydrolase [Phycisphaeraceae bacterium]|nr:HAD family hydrolase [Phycisphaeraceae bacterium]